MKTWRKFGVTKHCGSCPEGSAVIAAGQPVLEIVGLGTSPRRTLYRCERCAGEPAPKDLETVAIRPVRQPPPPTMRPLRTLVGSLPVDWQKRAAKDDA